MYHVVAHRPGGQPIGALERFFARIGKSVKRLIKRRDRRLTKAEAPVE
jgi:lipopolysaccharide export system permease protein